MRFHLQYTMPGWLREIVDDPFRRLLILALMLLGITMLLWERHQQHSNTPSNHQIIFFFHPQCPHCRAQKAFIPYLQGKYPELSWKEIDTSTPENVHLLRHYLGKSRQTERGIGVPTTFVGPYVISGFDAIETTGVRLEQAIRALLADDPSLFPTGQSKGHQSEVNLPFFGTLRPAEYSLPVLTVILGLVDGFNPCAMWVLVYLIGLVASLNDRRKIWLLVGTFVASSGILYFLFMTAWLNVFLLLGFLRPLTLIIGLAALGAGTLSIREYIQNKGQVVCHVGNAASKKKTMHRIDRIVDAPLTLFTIFSIIALAFIINSIEFACSAALPAIYTHALSLHHLAPLTYYGYILLYTFFFMLDDLIIFSLAILAMETLIGQRYAGHCRLVGGVVLLLLGLAMTFRPDLLR